MASENVVVIEPGKSTSSYQVTPKAKKKPAPLEIVDPEDSIRMEKENGKDKFKEREVRDRQKSVKKIGHRRVDETGQVSYKKTPSSALMAAIQLGLGHSVGRLSAKPERDVLMADFAVVEHFYFPSEGSQETPAHRYADFKFKTYAPVAFRYFRELFGMKPDDYMVALSNQPLHELSNAGASGSLFYVTNDDEFIIKTVQHKEAEFLQKLLPGYYLNLNQNKRTLLPKFFGLYCYQCGGKNIRLVVMNNLLPTEYKIHLKYDLKGSTYKRKASKHERAKSSPTLKDLDFLNDHPEGLYLEPDTYNAVMKTIQRDCMVLESFKIMDYSLLMGIHNLDAATKEIRASTFGDSENLIIRMATFSPSDPVHFQTNIVNWMKTNVGINKSKRLVFDLQGNSGGNVLLVLGFLQFLFGRDPCNEILFDIIRNPLLDTLFQVGSEAQSNLARSVSAYTCPRSFFYPCSFMDPNTGETFQDFSWYRNGPKNVRRGTGTMDLSKLFRLNGNGSQLYENWQEISDVPVSAANFSDVILVSRGFCGSSCAIFSAYIQLFGLGKTVVLGGTTTDRAMSFWSSAGGIGMTLDEFTDQANSQLFWFNRSVADVVPPNLPLLARQNAAVAEVYIGKSAPNQRDLPLEFEFHAATRIIPWHVSLLGEMERARKNGDVDLTVVQWVLREHFPLYSDSRIARVFAVEEIVHHVGSAFVTMACFLIVITCVVALGPWCNLSFLKRSVELEESDNRYGSITLP